MIKTFNRLYSFLLTGLFILFSVFTKSLPTHHLLLAPMQEHRTRSESKPSFSLEKAEQNKTTILTAGWGVLAGSLKRELGKLKPLLMQHQFLARYALLFWLSPGITQEHSLLRKGPSSAGSSLILSVARRGIFAPS